MLKYETYRIEVFQFVSPIRQNQRGRWWKLVLVAVKAMPVGSKPPAAVGERNFNGERHVFGAAAPFSTKTSSLQGRVEGLAFTSKLVDHIE